MVVLIQVPRFGKQFKTFAKVIPNLKLNVAELVENASTGKLQAHIHET